MLRGLPPLPVFGALALAAAFCVGIRATAKAQADADIIVPTYHTVKQSLAFIVTTLQGGVGAGSGFCISSNATTSYVLTNYHVIMNGKKILVAFQTPNLRKAYATVYRQNPDDDIAILAVLIPNIPALPLAKVRPLEGTKIATAGYPSTNIELALAGMGMTPSLHVGLVNALPAQGHLILFDAQTEHGNSGGPLFDINTAVVYGVVFAKMGGYRESNLAISLPFLGPFISASHLALAPVPGAAHPAPAVKPAVPTDSDPPPAIEADMTRAVQPVFPAAARANNWSGAVEIRVDLDARGNVTGAIVQKSSGYPDLDTAALTAAKTSGYSPRRIGDRGVPSTYLARYQFTPQ